MDCAGFGVALTAVLLNWKRSANVELILDRWRAGDLVSEAFVWNNNPHDPFPAHPWATVINTNRDLGLYTRFLVAQLATRDCILIQDDDLLLPEESLSRMYAGWLQAPEILHGVFGRAPKPDGSYKIDLLGDCDAPIILTRAMLADRRYFTEFFRELPAFAEIQADSVPFGNGEDIIFSYVVRALSGRLHKVYGVEFAELPAQDPIHARNGHQEHRTRLLRFCDDWLAAVARS